MPARRASFAPTVGVEVASWPRERVVSAARTREPSRVPAVEPDSSVPTSGHALRTNKGGAGETPRTNAGSEDDLLTEGRDVLVGDDEGLSGRFDVGAGSRGFEGPGVGNGARGRGGDGTPGIVGERNGTGPKLQAGSLQCGDLFPYDARVDQGKVTVFVTVDANGRASFREISRVSPPNQGFEMAARFCAERLRFHPAFDEHGKRRSSSTAVRLSFQRTR